MTPLTQVEAEDRARFVARLERARPSISPTLSIKVWVARRLLAEAELATELARECAWWRARFPHAQMPGAVPLPTDPTPEPVGDQRPTLRF